MDATLHALAGILLKAIPTFLAVIFLHLYLKFMFFKPVGQKLHERYEETEGARKAAEEVLQRTEKKAAEYEAALRAARAESYQAQERLYKDLQENETGELARARKQSEEAIRQAREALAKDVEMAKSGLAAESESLAREIADSLLRSAA